VQAVSVFVHNCGTPEHPAANLPRVHTPPPLLTPQALAVRSEGELVVVTVGGSDLRLHYEDALKVSQWIRVRAKEAKRRCGDVSRHWSTLAVLDGLKG
jgi:hypothetical protein